MYNNLFCIFTGHSGINELPSHGSLFTPDHYGTAGCRGNIDGGKGGGLIFMEIGDDLYVDGTIDSKGQDAGSGANAGGGSGGSVWITCGRFSGHGLITANGGAGDGGNSGGGSGGRIAIHTPTENKYLGEYTAVGGEAGDKSKDTTLYAGGPGTVYLLKMREISTRTRSYG